MKSADISVIIPLYNKASTIRRALESVLAQTLTPREIVVVDDGSTDLGDEEVDELAEKFSDTPIRLIRQANAGVSAARNRAIAESSGRCIALLDADDRWTPQHLADCQQLIERYPQCGIWATAFSVDDGKRIVDGDTPDTEGLVDFFSESLRRYVVIPSAAVISREHFIAAGGFPVGMRMGEDQYLWIKMARRAPVAFSPARTVIYSKAADNRSTAIYRPEECAFSFGELLATAASEAEREYIARVAIGKALVQSAKGGGGTDEAARAIADFGFTRHNRRALRKLKFVNSLPPSWRQPFLNFYNFLAWAIARKGL